MDELIEKMVRIWRNYDVENMIPVEADTKRMRAILDSISTSGTHVVVPKTALDWLDGSGPDANGDWFIPPENARAYWWRTHFRELIKARPRE